MSDARCPDLLPARRVAAAWSAASLMAGSLLAGALLGGCATGPSLGRPDTPVMAAQVLPAAGPAASGAGAARTQPLQPYRLAINDEIDLRIPDAPQFDQSLKVRPDGKVSLALIGSLHVEGRTPEDVEAELRERLHQRGGLPGQRDYLLQPNDEIELKFPWQPQLNELVRIRPDGKIQLPLAGTLEAQGLSPEDLQMRLVERYARVIRNPELAVVVRSVTTQNIRVRGLDGARTGRAGLGALEPVLIVRSFAAPQVFVGGEVGRPGVLAWRPGLTLLQALIEAGGALPTGDAGHLVVLRRAEPGRADGVQALRLDLPVDILRQPDRDVALQPFDLLVLPRSDIAQFGDWLNQYLFNILPPLKNSSFGFSYSLSNSSSTTTTVRTGN